MGKLPFVSQRDDSRRGLCRRLGHFAETMGDAWWGRQGILDLQKEPWLAVGRQVQPRPSHRQAVWGWACQLPSLGLSFLTCQVRAVASRLEESQFVSVFERLLFGQFLSQKVGRELPREKEPPLPSYTLDVFISLGLKEGPRVLLSLTNFSFSFRTSSNVIVSFESVRPGFKFQPCHLLLV